MLTTILITVNIFILIYFILLSMGYITLLFSSISDIRLRFKEVDGGNILPIMNSYSLPPVSVIMPAYNEADIILESVASILKNDHQNTFLVIINDGSTDNTMDLLINNYDLVKVDLGINQQIPVSNSIQAYYVSETYKNMTVIDKLHTDRSDTMNIGVNVCKTPFLVTIDADTLIEHDSISRLLFYMLSKQNLDAAGGGVYILNGCTYKDGKITNTGMPLKPIYAFQACEYLRSFMFSKSGWNALSGALCYSGTFTMFRTKSIIDVGGFDIGNLAQDFEIITHIRADQYERKMSTQVGYTSAAVVWTDVPGTLRDYWNQRFNWQYSTLESLLPYKRMLFNPQYGIVGLFTYPFFLFGEALGCMVEFTAYLCLIFSVLLGVFDFYTAAILYVFAWGFFTLLTMATALINATTYNRYGRFRDLFVILMYTIVESLGFRQFNIICRVAATLSYFFGGERKQKMFALSRANYLSSE